MMDRLKKVKTAVLLACLLPSIPVFGQTGFSGGLGAEANIITLDDAGYALGGGISTDYRFGPVFAAGLRVDAFYDRSSLFSVENRLFARWYFVRPAFLEFFFQGDAGLMITYQGPSPESRNSRGSPTGGLTLGVRIQMPGYWYMEPYIRGGYPYIAGGGLMVGLSPRPKAVKPVEKSQAQVDGKDQTDGQERTNGQTNGQERTNGKDLRRGEEAVVFRQLETVPEIAALAIEPYVYFGSNIAGFTGLDWKTTENNYRLLRELANFLKINPEYNLIIEGHANPVTNLKNEEQESLNSLSIERANVVADYLLYYGVDRKQLIIAGSGGTKTLVPWLDRGNWGLNRRVEFILIRQGNPGR